MKKSILITILFLMVTVLSAVEYKAYSLDDGFLYGYVVEENNTATETIKTNYYFKVRIPKNLEKTLKKVEEAKTAYNAICILTDAKCFECRNWSGKSFATAGLYNTGDWENPMIVATGEKGSYKNKKGTKVTLEYCITDTAQWKNFNSKYHFEALQMQSIVTNNVEAYTLIGEYNGN